MSPSLCRPVCFYDRWNLLTVKALRSPLAFSQKSLRECLYINNAIGTSKFPWITSMHPSFVCVHLPPGIHGKVQGNQIRREEVRKNVLGKMKYLFLWSVAWSWLGWWQELITAGSAVSPAVTAFSGSLWPHMRTLSLLSKVHICQLWSSGVFFLLPVTDFYTAITTSLLLGKIFIILIYS